MPLSDHEQRVLEQMEHALYAEDPRFASNLKKPAVQTRSRRRALLGVIVAVIGLALVLAGVFTSQIWLGGIGFGAMVLGGTWALTPAGKTPPLSVVGGKKGSAGPQGSSKKGPTGKQKSTPGGSGTFMQRMEQRWDKRRDSDR